MPEPEDVVPVLSPLRLLILSPSSTAQSTPSPIAPFLEALTGSPAAPEQISSGFAGYTTHTPLTLRTKYYHTSIGLWCDETGEGWKDTMLDMADEVREVRSVVGALTVVFSLQKLETAEQTQEALDLVEHVEEVRAMCEDEGDGREVVGVVFLVGDGALEKVDQMEEGLRGKRGVFGWDVVGWDGKIAGGDDAGKEGAAKNEYGEKVGIGRVTEILEAVPWTTSTSAGEANFLDSDNEQDWTTSEQRDLDREMMGLKMDLQEEAEEDFFENKNEAFGEDEWPELQRGSEGIKVEQLQGLMERLIATREAASEMSGSEKQKFAKREVERIMKEMG